MKEPLIRRVPLPEVDPQVTASLAPTVARLGYFGEFFQVVGGHQPEVLLALNGLATAMRAAVPQNLTEVIALSVCARLGGDCERIHPPAARPRPAFVPHPE